jgi:ADP-heptose:LPS heptosyltransferase
MTNSKTFGSLKSFLSSALPPGARLSLLRRIVERTYRAPQLVFPPGIGSLQRLLVILPGDPLVALHQLTCIVSLASHVKDARIALLCEKRVTPFFKTLLGITDFIEYDEAEHFLFSPRFDKIGKEIHAGGYDACLMLDPAPDLSLLYIAGQSAAAVRVGLAGAGDYPFINLHVNPAPGTTFLTDKSALVAAVLGVSVRAKAKWSVAKESLEEVGHMLREVNIDPASRLIGIDGPNFFGRFGKKWTQSLVDMLQAKQHLCYFFSYDQPEADASEWMEHQGIPVFANLPVSRGAALVHKSKFVVAGAGVLFELADLLRTPVAGVFTAQEFDALCKESDTTSGLRIASRPDDATIESVERIVDACVGRRLSDT